MFAPPVSVGTYQGNPIRQQRAGGLVSADVDPVTGAVYVGWEDGRYRSDAANDAVLATSTDNGLTWTTPTVVNPHPATGLAGDNLDHYNTALAASPTGLRVMWRQRQEAATTAGFSSTIDTMVASSVDGGRTFSAPLKVNTGPSDARYAAFSRGGVFQGDYDQLAIAGGLTYVVRCESYAARRRPDRGARRQRQPPDHLGRRPRCTWGRRNAPGPGGARAPAARPRRGGRRGAARARGAPTPPGLTAPGRRRLPRGRPHGRCVPSRSTS